MGASLDLLPDDVSVSLRTLLSQTTSTLPPCSGASGSWLDWSTELLALRLSWGTWIFRSSAPIS